MKVFIRIWIVTVLICVFFISLNTYNLKTREVSVKKQFNTCLKDLESVQQAYKVVNCNESICFFEYSKPELVEKQTEKCLRLESELRYIDRNIERFLLTSK